MSSEDGVNFSLESVAAADCDGVSKRVGPTGPAITGLARDASGLVALAFRDARSLAPRPRPPGVADTRRSIAAGAAITGWLFNGPSFSWATGVAETDRSVDTGSASAVGLTGGRTFSFAGVNSFFVMNPLTLSKSVDVWPVDSFIHEDRLLSKAARDMQPPADLANPCGIVVVKE